MSGSQQQTGWRNTVYPLILKDLFFLRWAVLGSLAAGTLALGLFGSGHGAGFHAGVVLLVTVLIALGALAAILTVVDERKEQTLPFIMSLPVSSRQFATAKILANALIFGSIYAFLLLGTLAVIQLHEGIPNGLTVYAMLILTEIAVSTCLILAVAMVTESLPWTISTIIVGNLFVNAFFYIVSRLPSFAAASQSPVVVWPQDAVTLLLAEISSIAVLLGVAYLVSSRRKDIL